MSRFAALIDPSSKLVGNLKSYAGEDGQRWLEALPARIEILVDLWHLTDLVPYTNLSFNFVAHAIQDEQQVVLKIGWEEHATRQECGWLTHYGQHAKGLVVPVLEREGDDAYLMRRLDPGTSLDGVSDDVATEILGSCVRALTESSPTIPQAPSYPSLQEWFARLENTSAASQRKLGKRVDRAHGLARELLQVSEPRLLHGDLHHTNVLKDADRWVVTDPKGVMGDPSHECAAMLRNNLEALGLDIPRGVQRRVDQLASITGFEAKRIAAWGYAQNVLSCVWALDANPDADVAEVIAVIDALQ